MKRHKVRYVDQRNIQACIDQLQAIIDGLRGGTIGFEEDEQSLVLRPTGPIEFDVRVDQLERKEMLRVEMSWRGPEAQREANGTGRARSARQAAAEEEAELALDGPITGPPPSEGRVTVHPVSAQPLAAHPASDAHESEPMSAEGQGSGWPSLPPMVAAYQQLYAEACMVGSDGQWHLDHDHLVQSLARAGVDPLTQQEVYSFALQADVDGRTSVFSERMLAALQRASQQPAPASS